MKHKKPKFTIGIGLFILVLLIFLYINTNKDQSRELYMEKENSVVNNSNNDNVQEEIFPMVIKEKKDKDIFVVIENLITFSYP